MKKVIHALSERIGRAIDEQVFPGCVVGIVDASGSRLVLPFGRYTYEPDALVVQEDTIYDVASITKAIPVSCLALKLLEQKRVHLDDRLIDYIPEFNNPDRESVLIRHLLTNTLHFGFPLSSLKNQSPERIIRAIFETPFKGRAGSVFSYSNATSILLGLVIEHIYGESLGDIADRVFFEPLHMEKTTFHPLQKLKKSDIVPTEIDNWRGGVVQGEVHDESAWVLPGTPGSAGLFSTAPDLLNFLHMILNHGTWKGMRFFSNETIRAMSTNQIENIGACTGLGWELKQPHYMGEHCSGRTIGKTGFTGCMCLCDMEKNIGIVLLSNYTYPERKADKKTINRVRKDVADMLLA
jgi:CubicO group peptidase (beta-lactamase class C family)